MKYILTIAMVAIGMMAQAQQVRWDVAKERTYIKQVEQAASITHTDELQKEAKAQLKNWIDDDFENQLWSYGEGKGFVKLVDYRDVRRNTSINNTLGYGHGDATRSNIEGSDLVKAMFEDSKEFGIAYAKKYDPVKGEDAGFWLILFN
jgi:hypothetical protein